MSWLYSQVLVAEYLGENCLDGEQSVPLSGSNTQLAYLPQDKMTDFSRLSRFGMMFKPLTEQLGQELLMSYQAAFRAKTFLPQEKEQELTENGQECGEKWQGLLAKLDPNSCSWKTAQCSLLEDLELSLQTFPKWGSMRNGALLERQMSEQITNGIEFGFVPNNKNFFHTPNTTGLDGGSNSRKALKKRIDQWPTPAARDHMNTNSMECLMQGRFVDQLANRVKMVENKWPSPKARDWKDGTTEGTSNRMSPDLGKLVGQSKETGSLNPTWVEWLMGWPLGWTELKPLVTDKSPCVPQQLGTYSKED
jgi:DNA (cytosine-5)-methyltransferase 1